MLAGRGSYRWNYWRDIQFFNFFLPPTHLYRKAMKIIFYIKPTEIVLHFLLSRWARWVVVVETCSQNQEASLCLYIYVQSVVCLIGNVFFNGPLKSWQ